MRRRDFITLFGGAAATWPLAARAQQPTMPVIGFLSTRTPDESEHVVAAFRRGLAESGYVEGQNVAVEYRWALGDYDRLPALAAELVRLPVAVLAATGGDPATLAATTATATIPVVATFSADPVARGLVASLNRPGGNVTGVNNLTSTLETKRFGLLRELVPQAATIGVLLNPTWPLAASQLRDMQEAAHSVGVQIHIMRASSDREIDKAFESASQQSIPALVVAGDAFLNTRRDRVAALATRHAVPAMYSFRDYAVAGGLMSYGIDLPDVYRQVGIQSGRILKGAKPADLPIVQPTKFELVINLKAAKALGLNFPPGLLAIADEVIE
jgi:putative ABC transport system substrate-binding protein